MLHRHHLVTIITVFICCLSLIPKLTKRWLHSKNQSSLFSHITDSQVLAFSECYFLNHWGRCHMCMLLRLCFLIEVIKAQDFLLDLYTATCPCMTISRIYIWRYQTRYWTWWWKCWSLYVVWAVVFNILNCVTTSMKIYVFLRSAKNTEVALLSCDIYLHDFYEEVIEAI